MQVNNNKLIAEFLGYTQPHPDYPNASYWYKENKEPLTLLLFDSDWNYLIEAVEKIESLNNWVEISGGIQNICLIGSTNSSCESFKIISDTKINATYKAVIKFIKWHNELNK